MDHKTPNDQVETRLTALWALTEITLGGVLHAMRIPLTGLFVGSTALACVYLIARSADTYRSVTKALIAVAVIKGMSSPQASPFSYLAMTVQALCCVPLVGSKGQSRRWVTAMFMLASLYSPIQKVAILYITFGHQGLAVVLGELRNWISPQFTTTEFLIAPFLLWFGMHLLAGFFLAKWLHHWLDRDTARRNIYEEWRLRKTTVAPVLKTPTGRRQYSVLIVVVASLLVLYLFESNLPDWTKVLWRPLAIMLFWQLVVRPILYLVNRTWLRSSKDIGHVEDVLNELPMMWSVLTYAQLKSSGVASWMGRVRTFLNVTLTLSVTRYTEVKHD